MRSHQGSVRLSARGTPAGQVHYRPSRHPDCKPLPLYAPVMSAVGKFLFSRWQDPRHPLYVAALFQVAIFVLILADRQYGAAGFVGGTIGCLIASLRLQPDDRQPVR